MDAWKTLKYFADHVKDPRIYDPESIFGVSLKQLLELDAKICRRMTEADYDYSSGKFSVASLGAGIEKEVGLLAAAEKIDRSSPLGQRMLASGISAWVRTHIVFNEALPTEKVPLPTQALYWTSATLLEQPRIFAVCAGYARLTQDLANALKMKCWLVLGVLRDPGHSIPPKFTHSWNVFAFGNAKVSPFYCPCDNTIGRVALAMARKLKGEIHHLNCFPLFPEEWGYFLWRQRATAMDGDKPLLLECALDTWTERQWRELDMRAPEALIGTVENWHVEATVRIIP